MQQSIYSQLTELVTQKGQGAVVPVQVKHQNGESKKYRLFYSKQGDLCYLKPRSRTKGFMFANDSTIVAYSILNADGSAKKVEPWEREYRKFMNYRKKFTEEAHPNLWEHVREGYKAADPELVRAKLMEVSQGEDGYRFYDVFRNLPEVLSLNDYKSTNIGNSIPKGLRQKYLAEIAEAIENKKEKSWKWRGDYDYKVSLQHNGNGHFVGYFSQEFKDCGNGHYWLLINPTIAVFVESD